MLNEFMTALGISVGAMFPIINPVGHAPMFYSMTQDDTPAFRRRMASKTSLYTFLILLVSLLLGNTILRFFGITIDDLRIAGGLLVARTAWNMLGNSSRVTQAEHEAAVDKEDISLTPMATPILSGPGAMSLARRAVRSVGVTKQWLMSNDFASMGMMALGFFAPLLTGSQCFHLRERWRGQAAPHRVK
jgi:MarC family membrane protein